jgi:hypothetical protein
MTSKLIAISKRNEGIRKVENLDDFDVRLWDIIVDKDEYYECTFCNTVFKSYGDIICPKCSETFDK